MIRVSECVQFKGLQNPYSSVRFRPAPPTSSFPNRTEIKGLAYFRHLRQAGFSTGLTMPEFGPKWQKSGEDERERWTERWTAVHPFSSVWPSCSHSGKARNVSALDNIGSILGSELPAVPTGPPCPAPALSEGVPDNQSLCEGHVQGLPEGLPSLRRTMFTVPDFRANGRPSPLPSAAELPGFRSAPWKLCRSEPAASAYRIDLGVLSPKPRGLGGTQRGQVIDLTRKPLSWKNPGVPAFGHTFKAHSCLPVHGRAVSQPVSASPQPPKCTSVTRSWP
jgi:hypothetical protein